jgi:hypothetical protein
MLKLPGVAAGVISVLMMMGCYAGLLLSLTLHLQGPLRFSPLHAGAIFAIYASGFATASLTWTRARSGVRAGLPAIGPLVMGTALLAIGQVSRGGRWSIAATAPLLFLAGAGHAAGFSPLANRLTSAVRPAQAADLSGLILTASLIGQVTGVAVFGGVYLSAAAHRSGHALALTTGAMAAMLMLSAAAVRGRLKVGRQGSWC